MTVKKRKSTRYSRFHRRPAKKAPKSLTFSYKRYQELQKYTTDQGTILSREYTGLSQKQQRQLARAVKRARHLVLLPFTQTL